MDGIPKERRHSFNYKHEEAVEKEKTKAVIAVLWKLTVFHLHGRDTAVRP